MLKISCLCILSIVFFLVLFPILTEFYYENDPYLSPVQICIILDILDIYIWYRGPPCWLISDFLVVQFILNLYIHFCLCLANPICRVPQRASNWWCLGSKMDMGILEGVYKLFCVRFLSKDLFSLSFGILCIRRCRRGPLSLLYDLSLYLDLLSLS